MDPKQIKEVFAFEPGKIYCLQVDLNTVNWEHLEAIATHFSKFNIVVVIIDKSMEFVQIPEGYEITKKEKVVYLH